MKTRQGRDWMKLCVWTLVIGFCLGIYGLAAYGGYCLAGRCDDDEEISEDLLGIESATDG